MFIRIEMFGRFAEFTVAKLTEPEPQPEPPHHTPTPMVVYEGEPRDVLGFHQAKTAG